MSRQTRAVATLCAGALLAAAPLAASSYDIGSWVEASYRCGAFPEVPQGRDARNERALSATADVEIDASGHSSAVNLIDSSGSDRFDRSVVEAVRTWRFAPRIKEGRPQPTSLRFRFDRSPGRREAAATTVGMPGGRDLQLRSQSCDAAP